MGQLKDSNEQEERNSKGPTVNRIIHQMWYQGATAMPEKYKSNVATWRSKNPDWRYMFWDEEAIRSLIASDFPTFLECWTNLDKLIKKCDSARYFILAKYGGLYADLDTKCHKSIDELMDSLDLRSYDIVFSEESQDAHDEFHWKGKLREMVREEYGEIKFVGNAVLISKPEVSFWLGFLEASFKISHKSVLESFSTWHLSKYLRQTDQANSFAILDFETMLSPRFIEGVSFFTHTYDATWFNHDSDRPWEG